VGEGGNFGGIWRRRLRQAAGLAVISGALAGGAGPASAAADGRIDGRDQAIVAELRLANEQQIALADLGKDRAGREPVRSLAEVMGQDHRAADLDLLTYADLRQMNLAYIGRPGADRPLHGPLAFDELSASPPGRFDYDYLARVVTDQQAAIDELESARHIAHDPQLVTMIDAALPTVRAHLARARQILAGIPEPSPRPLATLPVPMATPATPPAAPSPPPMTTTPPPSSTIPSTPPAEMPSPPTWPRR
jgi:predicted outer membrane protein